MPSKTDLNSFTGFPKMCVSENNLIITFASNADHKPIGIKVHISIINTFK